jgi:hypothetical protein
MGNLHRERSLDVVFPSVSVKDRSLLNYVC